VEIKITTIIQVSLRVVQSGKSEEKTDRRKATTNEKRKDAEEVSGLYPRVHCSQCLVL
jgi:hypothetical protein